MANIIQLSEINSNFYRSQRSQLLPLVPKITEPQVCFDQLSLKQKVIHSLVKKHLKLTPEGRKENSLQLLCLGCAGSGKSSVLLWLKKLLEEKQMDDPEFNFKVCSYTGMSAYNIGGETLHSAFHLDPFEHDYSKVVKSFKQRIQDPIIASYYGSIQYLIIDEISTVGLELLTCIHKMLQLAHPGNDKPFGGISVIVFGDPFQCPTIGDYAVWGPVPKAKSHLGYMMKFYRGINNCFFLDSSFRQPDMEYFEFLSRLRHHAINEDDKTLIKKRMKANLSQEDQASFQDALHVFPRRVLVRQENLRAIKQRFQDKEIYKILNGPYYLYLAIGAQVHLRSNFCLKAGLCNGSTAIVKGIVFTQQFLQENGPVKLGEGYEFNAEDVECIVVQVPEYRGNLLIETDDGVVGLPVYKTKEPVQMPNGQVKVMNIFKLSLAYAVTIHRSQGLTLDKVAVYLSSTEEVNGLDYVAFSRVRGWDRVMILDAAISDLRFRAYRGNTMTMFKINLKEEERVRMQEQEMMVKFNGLV